MTNMIERLGITDINQATVGIIGMKGTGKTLLTKLMVYGSTGFHHFLVFDTLHTFKDNTRCQKIVINRRSLPLVDKLIPPIQKLIDNKTSLIFSFDNMINKEIIEVTDKLLSKLRIKDYIVVFDEIQELSPQQGEMSTEVVRFIRTCRNKNNGIILNTQRPASVTKNIINMIDHLIVFRIVWTNDLKTVDSVIYRVVNSKEEADIISNLIPKLAKLNGIRVI